jgi:hypothetical protein
MPPKVVHGKKKNAPPSATAPKTFNNTMNIYEENGAYRCFEEFDYVHKAALSSKDEVWQECEHLLNGLFSPTPRNLLMLALGRTGSGNTHSMGEIRNEMTGQARSWWGKHIADLKLTCCGRS